MSVRMSRQAQGVVMGDMNCRVGPVSVGEAKYLGKNSEQLCKRSSNGELFVQMLRSCGLVSLNGRNEGRLEYTRKDPNSKRESVLDYIVVSRTLFSRVLITDLRSLRVKRSNAKPQAVKRWKLRSLHKKEVVGAYNEAVKDSLGQWAPTVSSSSVEAAAEG